MWELCLIGTVCRCVRYVRTNPARKVSVEPRTNASSCHVAKRNRKARRVLGRRPESPLASGEIPLSSVKGRRGELSCQSNSRGEPTRSEGFSLLVYKYFIQYKGRAPHPPRSSAPSPRGKAKSAPPFRLHKLTAKSKFERQISVYLCVEICFPKPSPVGKVAIAFTK